VGKSLKKESVAVDVISMGEIEDNKTKLQVGVCNIISLHCIIFGAAFATGWGGSVRGAVKATSEGC
jgi:hypothetical protein